MPREVVCISIGQAGVQMSSGMWELFCLEHGVRPDGKLGVGRLDDMMQAEVDALQTFFYSTSLHSQVPRAVFVDLEPTVIDEIRLGAYRSLFAPDAMLNHIEDASNNYARGHFTIGKSMLEPSLEAVRRQAQRCENLQGFFFLNGIGGGTGSGFANLLLERLSVEYGKNTKVLNNIFPGPTLSNSVVEPYNVALYTHDALEHSDVTVMLDNEAVYRICHENLLQPRPTFNHVNRLMAQVVSNITCSIRFSCILNADMTQLQTNLVPYPRIHFPTVSYAPIVAPSHGHHDQSSPKQIIKDVFSPWNRLVSSNSSAGKYMSCCTIFRGNCSPRWLNDGVNEIKKNNQIQFVDWCPTGFKIGICNNPPCVAPGANMSVPEISCLMLASNTAISEIFQRAVNKFDLLFNKRAFVHWFVGEGMEEGELNEAREDFISLVEDYEEAGKPTDSHVEVAEEIPYDADSKDIRHEEKEQIEDVNRNIEVDEGFEEEFKNVDFNVDDEGNPVEVEEVEEADVNEEEKLEKVPREDEEDVVEMAEPEYRPFHEVFLPDDIRKVSDVSNKEGRQAAAEIDDLEGDMTRQRKHSTDEGVEMEIAVEAPGIVEKTIQPEPLEVTVQRKSNESVGKPTELEKVTEKKVLKEVEELVPEREIDANRDAGENGPPKDISEFPKIQDIKKAEIVESPGNNVEEEDEENEEDEGNMKLEMI